MAVDLVFETVIILPDDFLRLHFRSVHANRSEGNAVMPATHALKVQVEDCKTELGGNLCLAEKGLCRLVPEVSILIGRDIRALVNVKEIGKTLFPVREHVAQQLP